VGGWSTDRALTDGAEQRRREGIATAEPAIVVPLAGHPRLSHDELVLAQKQTLSAARRKYSVAAGALFLILDLVYGKQRTMAKFKVLEIVARVPY
jgi:ubiquinol oxidase